MEQIILTHKNIKKTKSQYKWKENDITLEVTSFDENKNILFPMLIMEKINVIHLVLDNKGIKLGLVFVKNEIKQWQCDIIDFNHESLNKYFESEITVKNKNKISSMIDWVQQHINLSMI